MSSFNPWRSLERDKERELDASELEAIRRDLEASGIPLDPLRFTADNALRTRSRRRAPEDWA